MNDVPEQITTPEELDALPAGSVIVNPVGPPVSSVAIRDWDHWHSPGTDHRWTARELVAPVGSAWLVVYRPDAAPVEPRTLPTEAEVAEALIQYEDAHVHAWSKPWVGVSGNREYVCKVTGCMARRSEGGPGSTPKVGE